MKLANWAAGEEYKGITNIMVNKIVIKLQH